MSTINEFMKDDDIYLSAFNNRMLITMINIYHKYYFDIAVQRLLDLELLFIAAASTTFQVETIN